MICIAEKNANKKIVNDQIHFLICELCFWCASTYSNKADEHQISKCPNCNSGDIVKSISIYPQELN